MHTLAAVIKHGGFLYSSNSYNDDLPYWVKVDGTPHLIIPYTLEVNDMKFGVPPGYTSGDGWLQAMKDSFDVLYAEGARSPKMMSIGLHCRLVGRPSRAATLARFMDYVASKPKVWVATREEIARHWMKVHPAKRRLPPYASVGRCRRHTATEGSDLSVCCAEPPLADERRKRDYSDCSTHCSMPAAFIRPDWRAISLPWLNRIMVGMPWMPKRPASCCSSSVLTLAKRTLGSSWPAAFSNCGAMALQGPHHGAQKSTSSGMSLLAAWVSKLWAFSATG